MLLLEHIFFLSQLYILSKSLVFNHFEKIINFEETIGCCVRLIVKVTLIFEEVKSKHKRNLFSFRFKLTVSVQIKQIIKILECLTDSDFLEFGIKNSVLIFNNFVTIDPVVR